MSLQSLDLVQIIEADTAQTRTYSLENFLIFVSDNLPAAPGSYTDEEAVDAVAAALVNGSGISISYDDGLNQITIDCTITQYTDGMADARVAAGIATHEAAPDPHPGYLTAAEGNAAYSAIGHDHDADYEPLGAVAAHEAAGNPHPTYLTQAEGDGLYSVLAHDHDADYAPVLGADDNYVTDAEKIKLSNLSGINSGDQTITLTGNVTGSGTGSFATTIAAGVVTEAMQVLADNTTQDVSITKHGYAPKAPNNTTTFLRGDGTWAAPVATAVVRGHIWGLTLSNAADTANDITVAAGEATSESHDEAMSLSAAITKRLDAGWAVGDNQGGLNTGAEAANTWYEVHLIKRTDTGVVDVMFTTTANRATLPANYDKQRRIGWIRNDSGSAILQFVQVDDYFTLVTPQNDVSATSSATAASRAITAPPNSIARMRASCLGNTSINAANAVVLSELAETDTAPTTTNGFNSIGSGDFAIQGAGHVELRVNSSSQIRDRSITATGSMAYDISTFGWIDHRRRLGDT